MQYATAKVGAILININPAYQTSKVEYAMRQSAKVHPHVESKVVDPTTGKAVPRGTLGRVL